MVEVVLVPVPVPAGVLVYPAVFVDDGVVLILVSLSGVMDDIEDSAVAPVY